MGRISIHIEITIWSTTIAEKNRYLVRTFRNLWKEIPKHIWILTVSLRISLLSMNKIWKLSRITNKENWSIVSCHIPITLFSVKFNSKTTWISFWIGWSLFTTYSRETGKNRSSFTYLFKRFCFSILSYIMSTFKITMSTASFCMYNSFWDTFSIKMSKFINQMKILK